MTRTLRSRLFITRACARFPLHATNGNNWRRSFPGRNAPEPPGSCTGRRVVRQQNQKNLRADTDSGAAKTSQELNRAEEKRKRRKIADPKTIDYSGEISVALAFEKEKSGRESDVRGEAGVECVPYAEEKEKVVANSRSRFFAERFSKKETQILSVAHSDTGGISRIVCESGPNTRSKRNAKTRSVTFAIPQEKRSAGHDRGQGHMGL
jgi:hypothetical protein